MSTFITVIHVLVCLILMLTVLLQSGKGGMGAAFGGGGNTGTVFGGSGAGSFLRKLTVAAAVTFMLSSMFLAYTSSATGESPLRAFSANQARDRQLRDAARERAATGAAGEEGSEAGTEGAEGSQGDLTLPGDGDTTAPAAEDSAGAAAPVTDDGTSPAADKPAADKPAADKPAADKPAADKP